MKGGTGNLKIVCIGNSNVNGFPHRRSDCWASLFRGKTGHAVINKGVNGDNTEGVLKRFQRDVLAHRPDWAFILSGTNDFILLSLTPEMVLNNYKEIAELSLRNAVRPLFLTPALTDPAQAAANWFEDTDYEKVNGKLRVMRDLLLEYAEEEKGRIRVFDLQGAYAGGFEDGIHFTREGHRQIAEWLAALPLAP
jgi:lysophospholipase L1-like esterase